MQNYLIVNAFADNTNENIQKFSRLAKSSKCEVIDCQLKVMGHFFSSIFLFSGSWDAIAKIEDNLDKLQKEENISIQKTRTEIDELKSDCIAYGVDIIGPDQTNIVFDIPKHTHVKIDVYNVKGEFIESLLNVDSIAGKGTVPFS